ncbi:hypothetical protein JYT86_00325 [bacterium AH-315-N03]|nr:hypothetical protein [bacterium AH-315-N03]
MATILGLDIDPKTVRAVVIKTSLRKSEVVLYTAADIGPAETDQQKETQLATAVSSILSRLAQPPDKVITELSGDEVSIRKVRLPAKAAKKLDELLPFELEGQTPFDPAESVVDHQPIETIDGEMRMLAAVAPKERVAAHLERMAALRIDPREVAVGAVALDGLVPLLPSLAGPGPFCVLDIHPEGTDVCILRDGTCHFARTISVSTGDIDKGQQARLERELKQTLAAWRMEGGDAPSAFYVCGTMAVRENTAPWLGQMLGAEVEVLALPPAPGTDDAGRPAFGRAAALAGRALTRGKHLDARQGEFATTQAAAALRQHLPLMAVCSAFVVSAFLFSSYARYTVLDARHQQLEDELAEVTTEYLGTEARTPEEALRLLARGARGDDPMPQFDAYDALAALSASIPEEVTHDVRQLQIDLGDGEETGRFAIRGTVDTVSDTEVVMRAIGAHRVIRTVGEDETSLVCFHELELGNTTATADERRSYRIEGEIQCRPEGQEASDDDDSSGRRRRRRGRGRGRSRGGR